MQDQFVATVSEDHETTCWGCGLRLILPSYAPIFKCGWCGAVTNQNDKKRENKWFWWKRLRDRCFVCVLLGFMLLVIGGGLWAVLPILFANGLFAGVLHSFIAAVLSLSTLSTFVLASFGCAGTPPIIDWGSYPAVGKGHLENYTFCHDCSKPKSPRSHHCRSCGICILDMDHHCPFHAFWCLTLNKAHSYVVVCADRKLRRCSKPPALHLVPHLSCDQHVICCIHVSLRGIPDMAAINLQTPPRVIERGKQRSSLENTERDFPSPAELSFASVIKRAGADVSLLCQHISADRAKCASLAATLLHIRREDLSKPFKDCSRRGRGERLQEHSAVLRVPIFGVEILAQRE
ncbi:unnamed protein product [Linum tenue]|uniref:S-acyltransferase n=1 Tax=Linum tenue TaxID=586396 RepID=A0AAV0K2I8_9ROSI|nr:unnamed protein product [Linum tenue]